MTTMLNELIRTFHQQPAAYARPAFYTALRGHEVYVASPALPPAASGQNQISLPLTTLETHDGRKALLAFCSPADIARLGRLFAVKMSIEDAMRVVLAHEDYEALVIRDGDVWVGIPRGDGGALLRTH